MTKKLGIPMFTKPEATATAHNHPEGNAFYKNLVEIVSPEYDAISANGTGLVLGATNSLPLDTLIGGYLTYQTGDLVVTQLQEGVDFTGATYTLVDDTYRWAYVNENPFSEADLTAIAEEPNRIVEFAMDGTGLTNTQGVDDKFYGFREPTGATVYDALSADTSDIALYAESIRTATANSQTSIQWTCAELDANGVPTSYNSVSNTAIMHSDTSISTGFKPNIARYSIEETITGELADLDVNGDPLGTFSQRTEQRLLTHTDNHLGVSITDVNTSVSNSDEVTTYTKNSDNSFDLAVTTAGTSTTNPRLRIALNAPIGKYILSFDATVSSGTSIIDRIITGGAALILDYTIVEGTNRIEVEMFAVTSMLLYFNGTNLFDINVVNMEIREVSTQNKYYIDGIEQDVTPPLPDPLVDIDLNNTAILGYPDTIDSRLGNFEIHDEVLIP